MKILVLSDSHSALRNMYDYIDAVEPDAVIHLGDHYDDGQVLQEEFSADIPVYLVPGNCDRYSCPAGTPETVVIRLGGVRVYMTHGHLHGVKRCLDSLLEDARENGVQAVLYGHTHVADCHQEADGLWVLNPGSCGYGGGTAGILEVHDQKITACRILRQADLEDML